MINIKWIAETVKFNQKYQLRKIQVNNEILLLMSKKIIYYAKEIKLRNIYLLMSDLSSCDLRICNLFADVSLTHTLIYIFTWTF